MSSFRIDRQYVSYVPAETQSVYSSENDDPKTRQGDEEAQKALEEIRRRAQDIMRDTTKAATEKAETILLNAKSSASVIEADAKKLAEEIISKTQQEAESIREEARKTGYSHGHQVAKVNAENRKEQEAKELQELIDKLKSDYSNLVDGVYHDAIQMVMDIVKKIINIKLNESDEVFLGLVNDAIANLKNTGTVTIHVSSEDYSRYFGSSYPNFNLGEAKITITEEESYSPGDLMVESEGEALDYSINRQIETVEKAFSDEGN